ncbi:hypothetical protein [Nocardia wallacei]|uniref:hypothetical protein n=1 Tax=Nocardia wallacei TaxID=480035 RepID=UPI002456BA1C|nr:hypothetical protein [Nocardia wallacei]
MIEVRADADADGGRRMSAGSAPWSPPLFPGIVVFARGPVPALECERIATAVGRMLDRLQMSCIAEIRILAGDTFGEPWQVQVDVTVVGTPVRVEVRTRGPGDALPVVTQLEQRLVEAVPPA